MAAGDNDERGAGQDSALPPSKKNGWLYIFIFLGAIAIIALVLTAIYRETPRRTAIAKRNKIQLTQGVYALILSPVDSTAARTYTDNISQRIGRDSLSTKMVIGSTHVARQFVTLSDFRTALFEACLKARPANIRTQGVLLANIANFAVSDQLPSTMYFVGDIGTDNFAEVEQRLGDAINALQIRNQTIGPLSIVSYPSRNTPEQFKPVHTMFLNAFRERGLDVKHEDSLQIGR